MGKKLKPVPEGNKGLKKLPTEVRNKMGFMRRGGKVGKTTKEVQSDIYKESGNNISNADREKVIRLLGKNRESGNTISDADRNKIAKMLGMEKGGQVAGPKGYRRKPKKNVMRDLGYEPLPFKVPEGKKGDAIRAMFLNRKNIEKKNKGGLVKGGTSAQMTGKEYKGTF